MSLILRMLNVVVLCGNTWLTRAARLHLFQALFWNQKVLWYCRNSKETLNRKWPHQSVPPTAHIRSAVTEIITLSMLNSLMYLTSFKIFICNSIVQDLTRKFVSHLSVKKNPPIWNRKAHYHVHKSTSMNHIRSQFNPVHTFRPYFSKTNEVEAVTRPSCSSGV
jgi:hypothetical protein